MTEKILKNLREAVKNKKEEIYTKFEKKIFSIKKPNSVYNKEVPISERTFFYEAEKKIEVSSKKSTLLEKAKESRSENYKYEYNFKDSEGKVVKNHSLEDVNNKYSDTHIVEFNTEMKNQRHLSNYKGKNLDNAHDDIAQASLNAREVFSSPENLNEVKEVFDDSLKISEARGIAVHYQNEMFIDYFHINEALYSYLGITAVNLSKDSGKNLNDAPNAEVKLHSSLYKSTENSFVNSSEIVVAKSIAVGNNTSVFVTGDVPFNDIEIQEFIGNRRLITIDSKQTNFDYYIRVTLASGEEVVFRGDKKDRPINRLDNEGEINNSDANTYMYLGEVKDKNLKDQKIQSFCDKNISNIQKKIDELKNSSYNDLNIQYEINIYELQIISIETYRISQDIKDLKDFPGLKPVFYEQHSSSEDNEIQEELDSTKVVD